MSNMHRILWIDAQLRAARYPNASRIAEQFEISRRQAARDIEYMRYSLGAPLEFCAPHNGYRYCSETFALPAMYLAELAIERLSLRAHTHWLADDRCLVSFAASDALLGALLARPGVFRLLRPRWLADRLTARLTLLLEQNAPAAGRGTSCVPPGSAVSNGQPRRPPSSGGPSPPGETP